jgi:signal transduction histidine kinase
LIPAGLRNPSLARRLVLLAAGWSIGVLVISAVLLAFLFSQAALRNTDQRLNELIDNLIAGTTIEDGRVIAPALTDERALRVYSGRYWEIAEFREGGHAHALVPSNSLWDSELKTPADLQQRFAARPGHHVAYNSVGPLGEPLRAIARLASFPGRTSPVIYVVAEDRSPITRDIRGFVVATAAAFLVLGLGLIVAVVVQVRVGLRPLFDLRREVAAVRRGKSERLARKYPTELTPLADELNALVAHNQEVVERQRTHVGNLAHALKTPISVMMAEASQQPGPLADVVSRQAETMRQQVDHHLRRARAAARTQGQGERTDVAEVVDELARTLARIFRSTDIDWDVEEGLWFQGERQDLLEIVGNAMENACKFSAGRVRVRAEPVGSERLKLVVEDDGPGLTPEQRKAAVRRGERLDESAPGSGLGLSIIDELARAYGGALTLGASNLGGLSLEIMLPRAEA